MKKPILFLFFLVLLKPTYASALHEQDVLVAVSEHYPLIRSAAANIAKAKADYLSALGAFDPSIRAKSLVSPNGTYRNGLLNIELSVPVAETGNRFFTGYRIGRGKYPPYDGYLETFNYGEVRAGIEMPLWRDRLIDKRRAKIRETQIAEQISLQDARLVMLRTRMEAIMTYWNWVADGKQMLVQKEMLAIAQHRQTAFEKSVRSGDMPAIDAVDNKRMIMQRQAALRNAEAIFRKSALVLSLYYRDNIGHPIVPTLSDLPRELQTERRKETFLDRRKLYQAVMQHPKMQRLQEQQEASYVALALGENNLCPLLNQRIYLAQDIGGGNPPLNRTTINYEIKFELPLYQREALGQIAAAENSLLKIDQERLLQGEQIATNIQRAITDIKASYRVMQLTRQETLMARKVQRAENTRFLNGDSNLFILNQRELSTAETNMRYLESVRQFHISVANLQYELGAVEICAS